MLDFDIAEEFDSIDEPSSDEYDLFLYDSYPLEEQIDIFLDSEGFFFIRGINVPSLLDNEMVETLAIHDPTDGLLVDTIDEGIDIDSINDYSPISDYNAYENPINEDVNSYVSFKGTNYTQAEINSHKQEAIRKMEHFNSERRHHLGRANDYIRAGQKSHAEYETSRANDMQREYEHFKKEYARWNSTKATS